MKKRQAQKFWKDLQASTEIGDVITRYKGKKGYAPERTLGRYAQAFSGFNNGLSLEDISKKTGWSQAYVDKIHLWFREEFDTAPSVTHSLQVADLGHRRKLEVELYALHPIEPLNIHDADIVNWWSRDQEPYWPIPKGRAWRRTAGVEVKFNIEGGAAWPLLKQHLCGEPLFATIVRCKEALALDLEKRLQMLDAISESIGKPLEQNGLDLPVVTVPGTGNFFQSCVTAYYVFALYHESIVGSIDPCHKPRRQSEFRCNKDFSFEVVELGGIPVICSSDESTRRDAIDYFFKAQVEWGGMRQVTDTVESYRAAQNAAEELNLSLERIQLGLGLPLDSDCDLCKSWR